MGTSDGTMIVCVGTSGCSCAVWFWRCSGVMSPSFYGPAHAIGDVMARPPSTCTWVWNTVWPASGPVLTTSR